MADPISICQSILNLVVKVKGMLGKFHSNTKECNGILTFVGKIEAVVEPLQGQPDIVKKKGLSEALAGLNKALQDASEVVKECQKKSSACRFLEADAISKDLLEVDKEILNYMKLVELAIVINIAEKQAADLRTSDAHPDYQQVQKSVQTRHSSTEYPSHQIEPEMGTKKTDVAGRSEEKNEKDNALAVDIKKPHAFLPSDGSAKFTSVKSVIGQDGPCTANKDLSHRSNPGNGVGSSKEDKIKEIYEPNATGKEDKEIYGPNVTGSKNKTEKTNVPDDSNGSRAFLSYAKSTPVKSGDGQGHPRIVTKMISSSTRNMDRVKTIDMHPTEPWIVTGDMDGKVCIWNYEKQEPVMEKLVTKARMSVKEKDSKYYVYSTKFITKMNWLVVGDGVGYIHVYDYTNSKLPEVGELKAHNDSSVDLLAVHPTNTCLLSLSAYGKKIILCDWNGGALKKDQEFDIKPACPDCVVSLKFHPWYSNIFACVIDKKLMVGNIKFHSFTLKRKGLSVADYFFNRTNQPLMVTLSTSSRDAEIRNLETGKVIATLGSEQRTVLVAGHPTLPILVTALDDGTVCFWDALDASTYRLQKNVKHVTDEPALDLTFVTDVNDITRLAVTSESTIAIMEVSYTPMATTSQPTGGGDDE